MREWYDLTGHRRGVAFWPKDQQYRHVVPNNNARLQANCNLYDLFPEEHISATALTAVLNSTVVVLSKYQFGRPVGHEGNLKIEIVDVAMMLVPSLQHASKTQLNKLETAFSRMSGRGPLQFIAERRMRQMAYERACRQTELAGLSDQCKLDMPDRRALDHAVLDLVGIKMRTRTHRMDQPPL